MKPQSKIFEFYKNNLSEFSHFRMLPDSFDEEIEEILQRNKTAWPRLVKLCEGDTELMFFVLQGFLVSAIAHNEARTRRLRKYRKKEPETGY